MKDKLVDEAVQTAERAQQNVSNLPLTSVALAGLLGAGMMALVHSFKPARHR